MNAFTLDQEQQRLADETRRIAREQLLPLARSGVAGRVNRPLLRALALHGLLPRIFPEMAGGSSPSGIKAVDLCLLRESLARECTEAELALALQGLGGHPILMSARPELAARWIPRIAAGEAVAAFALTEPEAGSDPAALECEAERDGNDFVLTGTKVWISNAPEADVYTVFARTTRGAGARGVTAFCVPGDARGLSGEHVAMIAPHPIGRLTFDAVRVGADHVLGDVDSGFKVAMRTLDLFRPSVGAFALGVAETALELSVEHARTRRQGGKALAEHQAVAHALADMAVRVAAARLLVYAAASAFDAGAARNTKAAAIAKLYATEAAQQVVDAAIQVHGARALADEHRLAHFYREVRATRIYEGTSEIQRTIIARELLRES